MRRAAERAARRSGLALVVVDVDADPALAARYGHEVPVLALPGGVVLKGRVEAGAVEAAFASVAAGARGRTSPGVAARARRVVTSVAGRLGIGRKERT
jgi:hypothetical protein